MVTCVGKEEGGAESGDHNYDWTSTYLLEGITAPFTLLVTMRLIANESAGGAAVEVVSTTLIAASAASKHPLARCAATSAALRGCAGAREDEPQEDR